MKEIVNTPQSWKEVFNLDKGAILGLSHSFFNVLSFRPSTKHAGIDRLHFVGASTHPGTGVPICLAGSKVTSEQVLEVFALEAPWSIRAKGQGKGEVKEIDEMHVLPLLSNFHIALLALILMVVAFIWQGSY